MDKFLAKKTKLIQSFHVMDILSQAQNLAAQGRSVIHLEVGEPDFPTPDKVNEKAIQAIQSHQTGYTSALGLSELRQSIAQFYQHRYQLSIDPQRIVVTPGASGALFLVLSALLDSSGRVAMTDPGYPCNANFVRLLNGKVTTIPLSAEDGFSVSQQLIQKYWHDDIKVLLLASPANPTGRVIVREELLKIIDFVQSKNAVLIMDEIYQGLVYDNQTYEHNVDDNNKPSRPDEHLSATNNKNLTSFAYSSLQLNNDVCVINSFSKYFCMTGWRLGWAVVPESWVSSLDRIAQNIFLAPPTISQYAALAAFETDTISQLEQYRLSFQQRRDYLYQAIQSLGFKISQKPEGAFYLYADCSQLHKDSEQLARDLLQTTGVAVTPGKDFGQHSARQHIRFSYTVTLEKLERAVMLMHKYFQEN